MDLKEIKDKVREMYGEMEGPKTCILIVGDQDDAAAYVSGKRDLSIRAITSLMIECPQFRDTVMRSILAFDEMKEKNKENIIN